MKIFRGFVWIVCLIHRVSVYRETVDAFVVIPPSLHGKWAVPEQQEACFDITSSLVTATFRSAEACMTPNSVGGDGFHLIDLKLLKKPVIWDLRKIWSGLQYIRAIETHGIKIKCLQVDSRLLEVEWLVHGDLSGRIKLERLVDNDVS